MALLSRKSANGILPATTSKTQGLDEHTAEFLQMGQEELVWSLHKTRKQQSERQNPSKCLPSSPSYQNRKEGQHHSKHTPIFLMNTSAKSSRRHHILHLNIQQKVDSADPGGISKFHAGMPKLYKFPEYETHCSMHSYSSWEVDKKGTVQSTFSIW